MGEMLLQFSLDSEFAARAKIRCCNGIQTLLGSVSIESFLFLG